MFRGGRRGELWKSNVNISDRICYVRAFRYARLCENRGCILFKETVAYRKLKSNAVPSVFTFSIQKPISKGRAQWAAQRRNKVCLEDDVATNECNDTVCEVGKEETVGTSAISRHTQCHHSPIHRRSLHAKSAHAAIQAEMHTTKFSISRFRTDPRAIHYYTG